MQKSKKEKKEKKLNYHNQKKKRCNTEAVLSANAFRKKIHNFTYDFEI